MKKYFEKLYNKSSFEFFEEIKANLTANKKTFVITANPEIFMKSQNDPEISAMLLDDGVTVVADGIGVVKGAEILGVNIAERIAGVELAENLLNFGNSSSKSVFLLGAQQEVLDKLCSVIETKYPNLTVAGAVNGYVKDKDAVFEEIKKSAPDIVLVALGVPFQEKLIYKHYKDFKKGIFVGVGGSFDVLSGTKRRAPEFFIKHNIEWLYRILKEPKRIKRFYDHNIKFILKLKTHKN